MNRDEDVNMCSANTAKIELWMDHCREQHHALNETLTTRFDEALKRLNEIHSALYGNGREGIIERVKSHSQRIAILDKDVGLLKEDVDSKFSNLSKSLRELETRIWKMAIIVAALVAILGKALNAIDVRSLLGI